MSKFISVLLAVALLVPVLALAGESPASAANASLTLRRRFEETYGSFDKRATHETFSSPAIGDITGDGLPEIVAGAPDGYVRAWSANGNRVLNHWVGPGAVHASPALIDIDGNGVLDVLTASISGDVVVVRGNGSRIFHARDRADMPTRGVFGTPTAADIDRDGQLEIVATSWDHNLHVWNLDGSYVPGFPLFLYDTLWSSPAVADIDKDGWLEIIFGGDMDEYPGAPYPKGGLVWVIRHNGQRQPGWPRTVHGQTVWSSPAVVDLDGDSWLDVVVGTGLNWPNAGHSVQAYRHTGELLPGWPAGTGGPVMGSPAVGDANGDGRPDVAVLAEGGMLTLFNHVGAPIWSKCVITDPNACRFGYPIHGQVTMGDVDNDGVQEIVSMAEHFLRILDGRTGAQEASYGVPGIWAPPAAPAIAQVGSETWIAVNATVDTNGGGPGVGDKHTVLVWGTGQSLGRADWPTFKHNNRRTGSVLDTVPPVASMGALSNSQSSTSFQVSWTGSDVGSGVRGYDVHFRRDGGPWTKWLAGTRKSSSTFYGMPGEDYEFRVRAIDNAGNLGAWSASKSTSVSPSADNGLPYTAFYAVNSSGDVSELSSPPVRDMNFPVGLGRGIAVGADGKKGYVLDGWGGLHPIGNASPTGGHGYWPGWDIARGVALNGDGVSGYKVDAYGGLHAFGGAKGVKASGYWGGQDLTRDIVLLSTSTATNPAGYVLDAYGGLHPFGSAPAFPDGGRRWPGWAIARGFALNPSGSGGWIIDGWGGFHPVGGAPQMPSPGYWRGWDITRDVVAISDSAGYVLDGFGGIFPFGGAPRPHVAAYWGADVARGLAIAL